MGGADFAISGLQEAHRKDNVTSLTAARTNEQVQGYNVYGHRAAYCAGDRALFYVSLLSGEEGCRTFSGRAGGGQYQSGIPIVEAFGELQDRGFSCGLGPGRLL